MPHFVFVNDGVLNIDPVSDSDVGEFAIQVTIYEKDSPSYNSTYIVYIKVLKSGIGEVNTDLTSCCAEPG